jgi:hypothetical protein
LLQQKHVLQLLLLAKQPWLLSSRLHCGLQLNVDGLLLVQLVKLLCLRHQLLLPMQSTSAAVVSSSRPLQVSNVTIMEPEVSRPANLRIRARQDAPSLHACTSKTPLAPV